MNCLPFSYPLIYETHSCVVWPPVCGLGWGDGLEIGRSHWKQWHSDRSVTIWVSLSTRLTPEMVWGQNSGEQFGPLQADPRDICICYHSTSQQGVFRHHELGPATPRESVHSPRELGLTWSTWWHCPGLTCLGWTTACELGASEKGKWFSGGCTGGCMGEILRALKLYK